MALRTINTIEDQVRPPREDEHVRAEARRELLTDELAELPERFDWYAEASDQLCESIDTKLNLPGDEFRRLRGRYACDMVERRAIDVAMELDEARTLGMDENTAKVLSSSDLKALARSYGPGRLAEIHPSMRQTFYSAGVVVEASPVGGDSCHIAVEASHTCNHR